MCTACKAYSTYSSPKLTTECYSYKHRNAGEHRLQYEKDYGHVQKRNANCF